MDELQPKDADLDKNQEELDVQAEQVRQIYSLALYGIAATVLNSMIVFFVLNRVMPYPALSAWLAAMLLVTVTRIVLLLRFRVVSLQQFPVDRWRRRFLAGLAVVGAVWGSLGLFPLAGISPAHQVFIAFVLGGMAAGAASSFSVLKGGYESFTIPALLPITVRLLLMNDPFHLAMGVMFTLYGILLWRISRYHYKNSRTSLLLRFENRGMVKSLKKAKENLEQMYASLRGEVDARLRAEAELRSHQVHLQQAVEERTAELSRANEQLKARIEERKQAEQARAKAVEELRRSEALYRAIARSMPDAAVTLVNPELRILVAEGALLARIGLRQENLEGRTVREVFANERNREVQEECFRQALQGIASSCEQEYDGRVVWSQFVPLRDDNGRVTSALNLAIDITERKRSEEALRESEEQYRAFFELALVGIAQVDPATGRLLQVNARFCEITGYSREELLRITVRELTHPLDRKTDWEAFTRMLRGETPEYNAEKRYIRKDGRLIWVHVVARAVRDPQGRPLRTVGIIMDITERKQAEQERERLIAELERSNRELQQFAYVASHDLQEPLRTVSSYAELLALKFRGKLGPTADKYISFVVDGTNRMSDLINDLLTYSRVATRGHAFEPVDMKEIVKQVLDKLKSVIRENSAAVTADPLPEVSGDQTQLVQLIQNLITNAIKFRKKEVPPRIHISAEFRGDQWVFSVRDNGIGIEPRFHDRIFVIFQRLYTRAEYPGTGVGLAICKRIVERHGGRTWLKSKEGEGSVFYFSLPVKEARKLAA